MNFEEALTKKQLLESKVDEYSDKLRELVANDRNSLGLTSDSIKNALEYKRTKHSYNQAFRELREFNAYYVKQFKAEIAELRKRKYDAD
jgi:hypothetical protein